MCQPLYLYYYLLFENPVADLLLLLCLDVFTQDMYGLFQLFDRYLGIALHTADGELHIGLTDKFALADCYHPAVIGEGHRSVVLLSLGKNLEMCKRLYRLLGCREEQLEWLIVVYVGLR